MRVCVYSPRILIELGHRLLRLGVEVSPDGAVLLKQTEEGGGAGTALQFSFKEGVQETARRDFSVAQNTHKWNLTCRHRNLVFFS